MSERSAPVIRIQLEKHPSADSLSIQKIDGFTCVVRTQDFKDGDLACYIPPDEIVNTSIHEFSFLANKGERVRIKSIRLRGIWSMGLLVKAPDWAKEGDNLYEYFQLEHYEPELKIVLGSGKVVSPPKKFAYLPKYDVENGRSAKYSSLFQEGEKVWCTEKIHGANMSVSFTDGKIYVHSRTQWPEEDDSVFWRATKGCPELISYCERNPDYLVYGEVYGGVQKSFNYDCERGEECSSI